MFAAQVIEPLVRLVPAVVIAAFDFARIGVVPSAPRKVIAALAHWLPLALMVKL